MIKNVTDDEFLWADFQTSLDHSTQEPSHDLHPCLVIPFVSTEQHGVPIVEMGLALLLYDDRLVSLVSHRNRTVTGVPSWERWVRMSLADKYLPKV